MQWNGVSCCEFDGKAMETETTTWSEFADGWKIFVEQMLALEKRNKSKRAGLWESLSGIWRRKLPISVRLFEIQNRLASPYDGH